MSQVALLLPALSLSGACLAQDSDPAGRVARLALVQGQVSVEPAGLDEWAAADLNRPLTSGDKLWADADSRAELSIGSAVVRLGSATGFAFLNLDDRTAQMQLTAGILSIHVRSTSDTLEVDTPNVAVALLGPGDYRVEVNDAGDSTAVKVSGGTAEVTASGQNFAVHPQQHATFAGTADVSESVAALGAPDAFDTWAYERDRRVQAAQAWHYVSPALIGAEDLDQNGTWESTPAEGYVWAPNTVAVGWAPYRFGHWIWVSPWGWTWVDDARWGFAPFHYGRWATYGGRWCWVPGPRRQRPVYAPALVAWVSGAPSNILAGGRVGWFALGPREVFVPAYPVSQTYLSNVNLSNTRVNSADVTNAYSGGVSNIHYVNRNAPGALTAVPQSVFTSAQSAVRNALRLSADEVAAAPVSAWAPAITPARESLLGGGAAGPGIRRPPGTFLNRAVVARTTPPLAPVPFALQQEAIRAKGGRPLARSEVAAMQILAPAARVRVAAPAAGPESRTGMARAARPSLAAPPKPALNSSSSPTTDHTPIQGRPAGVQLRPALEEQPHIRTDRPRTALGENAADGASPERDPSTAEARTSAPEQELSRRTDRPATAERAPATRDAEGAQARVIPRPEDSRRLIDRSPASIKPAPVPVPEPERTPASVYPPHPVSAPPNAQAAPAAKPAEHAAKPAPSGAVRQGNN